MLFSLSTRPVRRFHSLHRRLWKRIIYLVLLCCIILLCITLKGDRKSIIPSLSSKRKAGLHSLLASSRVHANSGKRTFPHFGASLCPICLGNNFCQHFEDGIIQFTSGEMSGDVDSEVWEKRLLRNNVKIEIGGVHLYKWNEFSKTVCGNVSRDTLCSSSSFAELSFVTANNLRLLHKKFEKTRYEMPFLICATDKFVHQLKNAFDENKNEKLDRDEQLNLISGLVLKPEHSIMTFSKSTGSSLPIPNILGSCGQVMVREANWTPLSNYLKETFDVRAGIAIQVLQMVDDLQGEDPHWFYFNTEFSFESLAVSKDGEVILTNLKNVAVVDKSTFLPNVPNLLDLERQLCNELCFQKFTDVILQSQNTSRICSQVQFYGQIMYALACKQILSNLKEHKEDGFFNFDGHIVHKASLFPGLLHSIPEKDRETMEDLLKECVQETSFGGRKQAVEELRDVLEKYLNYEDQDENSHLENVKKDQNYEYDEQ